MFYIILVYDIGEKRVGKILKLIREYLHRIQNSVFEGYISDRNFSELNRRINNIIEPDYDSVVVFKFRSDKVFNRISIGKKNNPPNLLVDDDMF